MKEATDPPEPVESLSADERIALDDFHALTANGGVFSFLFNADRKEAELAFVALRKIGLVKYSHTFSDVYREIFGEEKQFTNVEREMILDELDEDGEIASQLGDLEMALHRQYWNYIFEYLEDH